MLGALIGAGASLLGGFMGDKSAKKAAAQNYKQQKEFAQTGIQWKVKDAEKAGIHPLYALGANTHSFSPSNVGSTALGEGIANAGQNIGRAIETANTSGERLSNRMQQLTIQRAELENTKLASEIALLNQPGSPPAPQTTSPVIPGQGVSITPPEVSTLRPGSNGAADPAINPDTTLVQTPTGYSVQPSAQAKAAQEDNIALEAEWFIRNKFMPAVGNRAHTSPPPNSWLPFGSNTWKYDAVTGQWRPWNSHTKTYGQNRNIGGR